MGASLKVRQYTKNPLNIQVILYIMEPHTLRTVLFIWRPRGEIVYEKE
jgi:hypothetical protein